MVFCVKRWFAGLLRIPRSRGFGVQSPFAYRFLREVVRARLSEEDVGQLRSACSPVVEERFRLLSLYVRLARNQGPCQWRVCLFPEDVYASALLVGCPEAVVVDCVHGYELEPVARSKALLMSLEQNWWRVYEAFADQADADSLLVVEDIHYSHEALRAWRRIQGDHRSGVSFDLYDCGIVFFDRKKYKQHYCVNL